MTKEAENDGEEVIVQGWNLSCTGSFVTRPLGMELKA